jgi:hypothetical protein
MFNVACRFFLKEYLQYKFVSTEEAKQKVSSAVERYRDGTGLYTPLNPSQVEEMNKYIESI